MFLKCTSVWILLFHVASVLNGQIHYVKEGGSGTGTSWMDASGDLSQTLSIALAGDEVWVASGIYYPTSCSPCSEAQRDTYFEIPDSVKVYGGFVGTETGLEQRDWENNATVLSGDINQDGLQFSNSFTVVHFTRVSNLTVFDGFVVADGYAHDPGSSSGERKNSGAAIFNQGSLANSTSDPVIRNCKFENNSALGFGGAVYNYGGFQGSSSPAFENCSFLNNASELGGGAVYNYAGFFGVSNPVFTDCTFFNNQSFSNGGGAVYNQGSESGNCSPVFNDCHFEGNTTTDYGGAVHCNGRKGKSNALFENCSFKENDAEFGGGVSNNGTIDGESNASFINCLFDNNHASGDGGGVYNWGSDDGVSNASVFDCTFQNNHSDFAGAGIFNNGINGECSATVTNCRFVNNVAITYGAAIYNNGKKGNASPLITNCLFQNNSGNSGGGVYNLGGENGNSSPVITNCTFFGNTANVGGAVYNNASDSTGTSSPVITNCIFWKNEANFGRVFRNILGTPLIQYSVVDESECAALNSGMGSNVSCGPVVLFNVYPAFEDTLNGNFSLLSISPLIDLGDNAAIETTGVEFDLNHENRIYNNIVDFGAFEYAPAIIPPSFSSQPMGDTLCQGESITLMVSVQGTPPFSYQWFKDQTIISGGVNPALTIDPSEASDSGIYYCEVTNLVGDTIISNDASVSVEEISTPSIAIIASDLTICEGESIQFEVMQTFGGSNPQYFWYLNGSQIAANVTSLELNSLNDNDEITAAMTSSLLCTQPATVYDSVLIQVTPRLDATVEITAPDTLICLGSEAQFESVFFNEGTNPDFQWLVNNIEILGQNNPVFITTELIDQDVVSCRMTSSETCLMQNPVWSNMIVAEVDSCITNSTLLEKGNLITLSPNPSSGEFNISFAGVFGRYNIDIFDVNGSIVARFNKVISGNDNIPIVVSNPGLYFIKIYDSVNNHIQRVIITPAQQ